MTGRQGWQTLRRVYTSASMTRDELLDLFRQSGALLDGHFRLSSGLHSPGYLQCALVLQHPAARRGARPGHRASARATLGADRRAVARARRRRHRPGGRARARRARDLRGAAGRRAHAAPRLHARRARSRARRRGRADDRRLHARDDGGRERRPARTSSAPPRSSIAAAAPARFDVPFAALLDMSLPTYEPGACPLCAQGMPSSSPGRGQRA